MRCSRPRVRNTVARWVYAELCAGRVDAGPLLAEAGLTKARVTAEDGWIPYESHAQLLEAAAAALGDPYYGLNLSRRIGPREFGALGYVGMASATLGEALHNLQRYVHVQNEAWLIEVTVAGEVANVTSRPQIDDFAHFAQATEAAVGFLLNAYRQYTGRPLRPLEVDFVHGQRLSRNRSHMEELLGGPVRFGRNRIELSLRAADLRWPITTADDRLLKLIRAHCTSVLRDKRGPRAMLSDAVRSSIAEGLSKGAAKASLVATDLGMTERSLHRRLAKENTCFGDILEALRHSLAEDYLSEAKLSIKQIAFLLGYADQSAFGAAYKRWTGRTPHAARSEPHR